MKWTDWQVINQTGGYIESVRGRLVGDGYEEIEAKREYIKT